MAEAKGDSYLPNLTTVRKTEFYALAICTYEFDRNYYLEIELKSFLDQCQIHYESYTTAKLSFRDIYRAVTVLQNQITSKNATFKVLVVADELMYRLSHFGRNSFELRNELITDKWAKPNSLTLKPAFEQELKRIETPWTQNFLVNPVHYLIETCKINDERDLARTLVYHLHQHKRLIHNHFVEVGLVEKADIVLCMTWILIILVI